MAKIDYGRGYVFSYWPNTTAPFSNSAIAKSTMQNQL
jgi:hypothetical protein